MYTSASLSNIASQLAIIGVKEALRASAAWQYLDFFAFFFIWKTFWSDWFLKEQASALKMQTSNNAVLWESQKPRTDQSVLRPSNSSSSLLSWTIGSEIIWDSPAKLHRSQFKSRSSLCRAMTKPPFLQFKAWHRSKSSLQPSQVLGSPLGVNWYLRATASLNSSGERAKKLSFVGRMDSQVEHLLSRSLLSLLGFSC